jgi:hypothetical protein
VKRTARVIALIFFSLAILLPLCLNTETVSAQNASYTIQRVDHEVEVMYSGHIIVRDTIHVTGQLTNGFIMGFPYKYGANVLKAVAYDENNIYPVSMGVQMGDRVGFYGVQINFGQSNPTVFTVVFILSNNLIRDVSNVLTEAGSTIFELDFPAYPSFVQNAATCNVSIVLPVNAQSITVTKDDGKIDTTKYVRDNLPAFTYAPAEASFTVAVGYIQIITFEELDRQITIGASGDVTSIDSYRIRNNSTVTAGALALVIPSTATNVVVRDEFGAILTTETLSSNQRTRLLNATLASALTSGRTSVLTVNYNLPSASSQGSRFSLDLVHFPDFNYYVDQATVTFVPPEGARFITPSLTELDSRSTLNRDIFQDKLSFTQTGVSKVDYEIPAEDALKVTYDYSPLWLAFRPTMWAWVLAIIGAVALAIWRRPKTAAPLRIVAPKASVTLRPENIRAFIEAYEERSRLTSELKSLDARAQKGKIPRRQYKVQRRTLEIRSEGLLKNTNDLKATFRSAGGVYADLARQLDYAETELDETETNIGVIETRYSRGDLPLENYKKQLADYQRRKEKSETTINGILLRLREELR